MLTTKHENKFKLIVANYRNGNRKDAASSFRKLSKLELALFMVNLHDLYSNVRIDQILIEDFIINALERNY